MTTYVDLSLLVVENVLLYKTKSKSFLYFFILLLNDNY